MLAKGLAIVQLSAYIIRLPIEITQGQETAYRHIIGESPGAGIVNGKPGSPPVLLVDLCYEYNQ